MNGSCHRSKMSQRVRDTLKLLFRRERRSSGALGWDGLTASDISELLELRRGADAEDNARSTPPPDEEITLSCVWSVEFYTPAHTQRLLDRFHVLGWDKSNLPFNRSNIAFLFNQSRLHPHGYWINFGAIGRHGRQKGRPAPDLRAPIPDSVESISGALYKLTPSISCIVLCFQLNDEERQRFDTAIRSDRITYYDPGNLYSNFPSPEGQKREEVAQIRNELNAMVSDWFRCHLPGIFSDGLLGGHVPTCELVQLSHTEPIPPLRSGETPPWYLDVVGLRVSANAWEQGDPAPLKIVRELPDLGPKHHYAITVKTNDVDKTLLAGHQGRSGVLLFVDNHYRELKGHLALDPLLNGYLWSLQTIRDSYAADLKSGDSLRSNSTLRAIRKNASFDMDSTSVANDLIGYAGESTSVGAELRSFDYWQKTLTTANLADVFYPGLKRQASYLREASQALRDHLLQYGSAQVAAEASRVEKRAYLLTWMVAILAIVTLMNGWIPEAVRESFWIQLKGLVSVTTTFIGFS